MRTILKATVAVLGVVIAHGAAQAADFIEEPIYVEPAPPVYVEAAGGFYIRGDLGYVKTEETSGHYKYRKVTGTGHPYAHAPHVIEEHHYSSIDMEESFSVGGGVGYRFNDYARVDFTADWFKGDLRGSSACAGFYAEDCRYDDKSDAGVWTVMANAYVDVAKFGSVTPYLGAGAGFAHVKYGSMKNTFKCGSDFGHHTLGTLCDTSLTHEGESDWRFAYSLMAGASVDITTQLKFDAGYKYTHIADGAAFGWDEQDKAAGMSGVQGYDNGYDIHAIRAGLRYEFGGGGFGKGVSHEPAPFEEVSYEPEPIVYK